jgi:hypothetical protein
VGLRCEGAAPYDIGNPVLHFLLVREEWHQVVPVKQLPMLYSLRERLWAGEVGQKSVGPKEYALERDVVRQRIEYSAREFVTKFSDFKHPVLFLHP